MFRVLCLINLCCCFSACELMSPTVSLVDMEKKGNFTSQLMSLQTDLSREIRSLPWIDASAVQIRKSGRRGKAIVDVAPNEALTQERVDQIGSIVSGRIEEVRRVDVEVVDSFGRKIWRATAEPKKAVDDGRY